MICAAESGLIEIRTRPDITKVIHPSKGIRPSVIPGHRIERIVAMILVAVPMLPKPDTRTAIVHYSALWPGEKSREINGAYAHHPTSGALPVPLRHLPLYTLYDHQNTPHAVH